MNVASIAYKAISSTDVDLDVHIDQLTFLLSKDEQHIAFVLADKVHAIRHIIGHDSFGEPIDKNNPQPIKDVNINGYKSPRSILSQLLKDKSLCNEYKPSQDDILAILNSLSVRDSIYLSPLDAWPYCDISYSYIQ